MRQFLPKKYRGADLALVIPNISLLPKDDDEFADLVERQDLDQEGKDYLLYLWLAGGIVFWIEELGIFATPSTPVAPEDAEMAFRDAIEKQRQATIRLTEQLRQRRISQEEWYGEMKDMIEQTHRWAFVLMAGPSFLLIPHLRAMYEAMTSREIAFLQNFLAEVRSGKQRLDGTLPRRAALYAVAALGALYDALRYVGSSMHGYTHEQNILGIAEHCDGCLEQTARGVVPIGTLVPIGDRDCLSNCKCRIVLLRL